MDIKKYTDAIKKHLNETPKREILRNISRLNKESSNRFYGSWHDSLKLSPQEIRELYECDPDDELNKRLYSLLHNFSHICEICIEESKCHIGIDDAAKLIRECLERAKDNVDTDYKIEIDKKHYTYHLFKEVIDNLLVDDRMPSEVFVEFVRVDLNRLFN